VRFAAISEATREDIYTFLGVPREEIPVVYNGLDHDRFRPQEARDISTTREKYGLSGRFLLFVGSINPRKNVANIYRAFGRLQSHPELRDVHLVMAGADAGYGADEINRAFEAVPDKSRIKFLGHVPLEALPPLYGAAEALVYPSFWEGFGLPILEAMACGGRVITSNTSSMPEVAGDAALLVDPHSHEAIAEAMLRALSDTDLRANLVSAGLRRAAEFTWSRTIAEYLEIYRTLDDSASPSR
ncbi:MAG: glycosyltransferase family 4 protein, partial [Myxococcales bacterium]|nr:glycosyltransferase family 4 protein [Myxococcales bacterium]